MSIARPPRAIGAAARAQRRQRLPGAGERPLAPARPDGGGSSLNGKGAMTRQARGFAARTTGSNRVRRTSVAAASGQALRVPVRHAEPGAGGRGAQEIVTGWRPSSGDAG